MNVLKLNLILIITILCSSQEQDHDFDENCQVDKTSKNTLACSQIPISPIESYELVIDEQKVLKANSFLEYYIKEKLRIEFRNIKQIEPSAFNGLFAEENAQIKIDIINSLNYTSKTIRIGANVFKGAIFGPGVKVELLIKDYENVEFFENPFNGINQIHGYSIDLKVLNAKRINFKENKVDYDIQYEFQDEDNPVIIIGDDDNLRVFDDESSLLSKFDILIDNAEIIHFEKNSFSNLEQKKNSLFTIEAKNFKKVLLQTNSFSNLTQNEASTLELNFKGESIEIYQETFTNTTQKENSSFIINVDISESHICLPSMFVSNLAQINGSQFHIELVSANKDLFISQNAFNSINQDLNSIFSIRGSKFDNVFIEKSGFLNVNQDTSSLFGLSIQESNNLIFDIKSISKFSQKTRSKAKISFNQNRGLLYQPSSVFDRIIQDSTSDIEYEFDHIQRLKFPPRAIPRLILLGKNDTILNSNSKPKQISISYHLKDDNFCSIIDIPSDILVKLPFETKCTCTIFYLYRNLRALKSDTLWINHTPNCYKNTFHNGGFDRIKLKEKNCNFDKRVLECRSSKDYLTEQPSFDHNIQCGYLGRTHETSVPKIKDTSDNIEDYVIDPSVEFISTSPFFDITKATSLGILIAMVTTVIIIFLVLLIVLIVKLKISSNEDDNDDDDDVKQDKTHSKRYGRPYKTGKNNKKYSSMDSDSYLIQNKNQNDSLLSNESKTLVVKLNGDNALNMI